MTKVYVITKKLYCKGEQYFAVKCTMEDAEKAVLAECSNARKSIENVKSVKFLGRDKCGNICIMYIREETI